MELVQIPECGGFDLNWADKLRKSIAKKNPAAFEKLEEEYFKVTEKKGLSQKLCNYVWRVLVSTSKGYGFNLSHTLAYSLIALQEMNLAFRFPIMFWNCACLISDSGGAEEDEFLEDEEHPDCVSENKYDDIMDFCEEPEDAEEVVDIYEEEDYEGYEYIDAPDKKTKTKKKRTKNTNYGKIASAIGKIKANGVAVAAPDINKSTYTFSPDVDNNTIRYGLSGITRIGEDLILSIIENRPYSSMDDFLNKVKVNKTQMINLIKCGAFDGFGDREKIMMNYVLQISDTKKRVTLQNMKMLIDFDLIPEEYDLQKRVFNFNKYLKKRKVANGYGLDDIAYNFYEKHFDVDKLVPDDEYEFVIGAKDWDNYYQWHMDVIRPYIKKNNAELLKAINDRLIEETWNKYCLGSLSKWEMDSVSFYSHEHELVHIQKGYSEITDFCKIPENPIVEKVIPIKGRQIPIMKLYRIAGTVLDRDKVKKTITLLTTDGVVTVKVFGQVFSYYDKQISEKGTDGKKHVIEKSWLQKGNKIIVTGIRQGDGFLAKKYSRTPFHLIELITDITEDGYLITKGHREGEE